MNIRFITTLIIVLLSTFGLGLLFGVYIQSEPVEAVEVIHVYVKELPTAKVEIQEPEDTEEPEYIIPITEDEIDLLSRLVSAEARGESYEGMVAVANVVLNRLRSPKWKPDTIEAVIFEPRQFQPVSNGAIYNKPTEEAVNATLDALRGTIIVPEEVDCFANKKIDFSSWANYYITIGNHKFWVSK